MPTDKEVLYSMLRREVDNLIGGMPLLSAFGGTITSNLIKWIDPYVSAFIDEDTKQLDVDQLGDFASEEVDEKIKSFKERYKAKRGN